MRRTLSRFKVVGRGARRPRVRGSREHGGTLRPPVQLLLITRWSARATSVLALGMIGAFVLRHGLAPAALSAREWILMLFLLWSLVGLILAWRWPLPGGALSLVGLIGFHVLEWVASGQLPGGWFFPALAIPGALFLVSGRAAHR
jgi:hypothetical protein